MDARDALVPPDPCATSRVARAMSGTHVLPHVRPAFDSGNDVVRRQRIPRFWRAPADPTDRLLEANLSTRPLVCPSASWHGLTIRALRPRRKQLTVSVTDAKNRTQRPPYRLFSSGNGTTGGPLASYLLIEERCAGPGRVCDPTRRNSRRSACQLAGSLSTSRVPMKRCSPRWRTVHGEHSVGRTTR